MGRCKLEAILVLRIQDGNDIFLAASGAYAPSFFGLSLSTLADLPRCEASDVCTLPPDEPLTQHKLMSWQVPSPADMSARAMLCTPVAAFRRRRLAGALD